MWYRINNQNRHATDLSRFYGLPMFRKLKKIIHLLKYYEINNIPTYIRSAYVNFKYLPIKQAIYFPIFVNRMKITAKGKIEINTPYLYQGMIRLGFKDVGIYPDNGIVWENGGKVIFHGPASIGNDSYVSVSSHGTLEFGQNFSSTCALKIACSEHITFEDRVIVGWGCTFMDTNFHKLYDIQNEQFLSGKGPIVIGKETWFAQGCTVMHSVVTPPNAVFAMNSIISKNSRMKSFALMGGTNLRVLRENIFFDVKDNQIHY